MLLEGLVIPISFEMGLLTKGIGMITGLIEGAVKQTFDWAEGMDKLGDVTGMTTEQTAAWAFVAKKAGVEVDTLANSSVILAKGLFDSAGKLSITGKALEDFGIGVKDASGNVKDQSTLMNDIAKKYASFGTQTQRVDFLTNLFGRSGAQLVDVFDTLAQEGGIDAVEKKVKDLGLAIDPATYEKFTRNLEELKMAGTGLAVEFVNNLMPAAEALLNWAKQFEGLTPDQILTRLGEIANTLPEKFQAWAENMDWGKVSQDIINGINSINWSAVGKATANGAKHIVNGLYAIFKGVNWGGLFESIGTAFMDFSTGLAGSDFASFKAVWQQDWNQAQEIVRRSVDNMRNSFQNFIVQLPFTIANGMATAYYTLKDWVDKMLAIINNLMSAIGGVSNSSSGLGSGGASVGGTEASGGYAGGMTWVGESGPELVNLPQGSYVNNNQSSSRMAQGPVQAYIDYDELARTMARVLGQSMQRV